MLKPIHVITLSFNSDIVYSSLYGFGCTTFPQARYQPFTTSVLKEIPLPGLKHPRSQRFFRRSAVGVSGHGHSGGWWSSKRRCGTGATGDGYGQKKQKPNQYPISEQNNGITMKIITHILYPWDTINEQNRSNRMVG